MQILEGLKCERNQLIAELWVKSLAEQFLLVHIIGHVTRSVTSKTVEFTPIGTNVNASLVQLQELLPYLRHVSPWYESRTKGSTELLPGVDTAWC